MRGGKNVCCVVMGKSALGELRCVGKRKVSRDGEVMCIGGKMYVGFKFVGKIHPENMEE